MYTHTFFCISSFSTVCLCVYVVCTVTRLGHLRGIWGGVALYWKRGRRRREACCWKMGYRALLVVAKYNEILHRSTHLYSLTDHSQYLAGKSHDTGHFCVLSLSQGLWCMTSNSFLISLIFFSSFSITTNRFCAIIITKKYLCLNNQQLETQVSIIVSRGPKACEKICILALLDRIRKNMTLT